MVVFLWMIGIYTSRLLRTCCFFLSIFDLALIMCVPTDTHVVSLSFLCLLRHELAWRIYSLDHACLAQRDRFSLIGFCGRAPVLMHLFFVCLYCLLRRLLGGSWWMVWGRKFVWRYQREWEKHLPVCIWRGNNGEGLNSSKNLLVNLPISVTCAGTDKSRFQLPKSSTV
jgi:hypothetical protein